RTAPGPHRLRDRLVAADLPRGHHPGRGRCPAGLRGSGGLDEALAGTDRGERGVRPGASRSHRRRRHRKPGTRPGSGAVMSIERVLSLLASTITLVLDHPWILLPAAAVTLVAIVLASPAGGASETRDPQRAFTAAERREAFERAGLRCEHKPLLWHRCTNTPTQGDHIYPWSKGGRTAMSNQQALCPFHNARKSGSVPTRMYIYRLQWRRRRYFPDGTSPQVEWRPGATL